MSARRWTVVGWAVVCLAGIAAEPATDPSESPAGEPTPTGSYAVDCEEIADDVEQARLLDDAKMRAAGHAESDRPPRPSTTVRNASPEG
ncbi:hypothetical protein [Streptomyces sp. GC420]|uniref:hypothetical protein n=1 Tax=Streptomyces sp. GC420 TaxID=2697568 RepID=UPI001414D072|nr:hypothetical protein [Streptomyces sp. GC420]NBM16186.1 hypothetical protein [Streptomyces sp. GC420]